MKFRNKPNHNEGDGSQESVTRELFDHLAQKANRGNREATQRLREIIQTHPEIWQEVGDLTGHVEQTLIDLVARGNVVLEESVKREAEELRKSLLAEASDQMLERLLIRQVVVCWLDTEFTRMASLQPQQFKQDGQFWEQRIERASGRYLKAIEELGTLRGLLAGSAFDTSTPKPPSEEPTANRTEQTHE